MKLLKTRNAVLLLGVVFVLFSLLSVNANATAAPLASPSLPNSPKLPDFGGPTGAPKDAQGVLNLVSTVMRWMFYALLTISGIFILLAAFNYLFAGGDAEKLTTAKNYLIYAAVAIVVGVLAFAFVNIISGIFGFSLTK